MYEVALVFVGAVLGWLLTAARYARLQRFLADPTLHEQLAALVSMCSERDAAQHELERAEKAFAAARSSGSESFSYATLDEPEREAYDRAGDLVEKAEGRLLTTYKSWLSFNEAVDGIIKRHRMSRDVRDLLLNGHNPPVTPQG